MSRHPSYGKSASGGKKRNVLKRYERIDALRDLGKWKDGENKKVTNLPKTHIPKECARIDLFRQRSIIERKVISPIRY